jgi:hypothetical protein
LISEDKMAEPFVSFDGSQLQNYATTQAPQLKSKLRVIAWTEVRKGAFEAERRVKVAMPVLTGRARASWGHSAPPALPGDGIWIEDEDSLTITEGTRVDYVQHLNEGSSRQAPAGFIDAIAEAVSDLVNQAISDAIAAGGSS